MQRTVFLPGLLMAAMLGGLSQRQQRTVRPAEPTSRSPSENLGSPAAPGSAQPNLAVAPDGRVYLTWLEPVADSGYALRLAVHDGSRWSPPSTIRLGRDFFVNWADFPSLAVLGEGRLAAHWLQRESPARYAYGVRVAFSRDGGRTWGAPVMPHRDITPTEHGFVALWNEGGTLGVVWLDGRKFDKTAHQPSNEMMLVTTRLSPDGSLGAETRLDERACDCCQTAAAMTSSGPIVVYRDRSADEIRDIYVVRRLGERWTAPAVVHTDGWHIAACPVNGPAISARARRVAVAWFTAASDSPRVNVAYSDDAGATFGAPIRVDEGNPAGRVDVAMLRDGSTLVSWIERTGGDTAAVRARRVARDGRLGPPMTVTSSSAARASGFPRMALTVDHVVFAWTVPSQPSLVQVARASMGDFK